MKRLYVISSLVFASLLLSAQERIVVDAAGSGAFKTVQEAVNSLPDSAARDRVIFIKNGIYHEQVYIGKHRIRLEGESKEKTVITGSVASLIYSCGRPGDGNTAVLNLDGNDLTLSNLTVENTYGRDAPDSVFIDCTARATGKSEKVKVIKTAHQFALKSGKSTRLRVLNCIIRAWGNDTVSPWNGETGMYYFNGCTIIGGTDFYCPRGWAYAENCTFITNVPGAAAAIWHDGSKNEAMKSVFRACRFKGDVAYNLGRYHHEANFYLLNCWFDKNMNDVPVFKAATAKPMVRDSYAYYFHCTTEGKRFDWLKDNLATAPGSPAAETITPAWTFEGKWDPAKIL